MIVRSFSRNVQSLTLAIVAVAGISFAPSAVHAQAVYQNFTCEKPGENSEATSATGLQLHETVTINGNANLSTCIKSNDNGCVYGITLNGNSGVYDYELVVDAEGPHGLGSGNMYLEFTDESGDTYKLKVFSSTRATHTVRYNSKKPAIKKIKWSN